MQDYRMAALKRALQSKESSVNIKEGGGMTAGILDENAAESQREYLELLGVAFQKMREHALDKEETESTLMALILVFNEETEELCELCDMVEGFEDVKSAWCQQNEVICSSLKTALRFYETNDVAILDSALTAITQAMEERLPLYAEMVEAEAIVEEDEEYEDEDEDFDDEDPDFDDEEYEEGFEDDEDFED